MSFGLVVKVPFFPYLFIFFGLKHCSLTGDKCEWVGPLINQLQEHRDFPIAQRDTTAAVELFCTIKKFTCFGFFFTSTNAVIES